MNLNILWLIIIFGFLGIAILIAFLVIRQMTKGLLSSSRTQAKRIIEEAKYDAENIKKKAEEQCDVEVVVDLTDTAEKIMSAVVIYHLEYKTALDLMTKIQNIAEKIANDCELRSL